MVSKQYLIAIINGAEIALEPSCTCRPCRRFIYNTTDSSRNRRDTPMKIVIFRTLNIISVAADGRQTEELLISGHNVAVR